MRKFENEILVPLNKLCNGEAIFYIGLGAHDFQLAFGNLRRIQTFEKAVFFLQGNSYSWTEGPADIPVWLLIGQTPIHFVLPTPFALRMCLASGDYVEFYTGEHQYESTLIDFGEKGEAIDMEIF